MIYRALECSVFDSTWGSLTVWFQCHGDESAAHKKLAQLLSLAWDVEPEQVCVGHLRSELKLIAESLSTLPMSSGDLLWLVTGSAGDSTLFDDSEYLVMLDGANYRRLARAYHSAQSCAARQLQGLRGELVSQVPDSREAHEIHWRIDDMERFVGKRPPDPDHRSLAG